MKGLKRLLATQIYLLLGALLGGCGGTAMPFNTPTPPPCQPHLSSLTSAQPSHLYVSDMTSPPGHILVFQLPLTATSTPILTLTVGFSPSGLVVSRGQLYVGDSGSNRIHVFSLPLTSSSAPVQTLTTAYLVWAIAADPSGTIYASDGTVFPPGATQPAFTLNSILTQIDGGGGITVDSKGNLFAIYYEHAMGFGIGYFSAPVSAGQPGIMLQRTDFFAHGITSDSCDNLYVNGALPSETELDRYNPPYTTSSIPASSVFFPQDALLLMQIASNGMLYVGARNSAGGSQIDVLPPPYTSVSLRVLTPTAFTNAWAVAAGQ